MKPVVVEEAGCALELRAEPVGVEEAGGALEIRAELVGVEEAGGALEIRVELVGVEEAGGAIERRAELVCVEEAGEQLNLKKSPQLKNLEDIINYYHNHISIEKATHSPQITHSPNFLLLI